MTTFIAVSCLLFFSGLAGAQSLGELAKKEKERRESAPATHRVPVITEEELLKARGGSFSVMGQPLRGAPDEPTAVKSGMDEMRERAASFEQWLAELARSVRRRDDDLRRYVDGCYEKYTLEAIPTLAGYRAIVWDDYWIPLLALANETMPECRVLWSDIVASSSAIREERLALEEAARQKGVLPGLMRDLGRKHGLDWPLRDN